MVYQSPDEEGGREYDETQRGGPGGDSGGCGAGTYGTVLNANGDKLPDGQTECVDTNEARRRSDLYNSRNSSPQTGPQPRNTGGAQRPSGGPFNPGPVPVFNAPPFTFDEKFAYPTFEAAQNEPGYKMRLGAGLGALQNTAAARGTLRSGATLKGLNDYAQEFASNEYGNVANRALMGYNTRRQTAQEAWENLFRGRQAEFAPQMVGWTTNAQLGDNALNRAQQMYMWENLSGSDILRALGGGGY